ncbi:hypothetical protein T11_1063 [Trichinella zimbabwensis]|uniref:Uncharacterized protein n=1 Tax=Trichinella zimbabwensis TaxID=268475 RepID=A0A0V1HL79_9BILA|nr:hypothetical protein T11_1063 [Trichinella zimbabwensis]
MRPDLTGRKGLLLTADGPHIIVCQQHQNSKAVPLDSDVKLSIEASSRSRRSLKSSFNFGRVDNGIFGAVDGSSKLNKANFYTAKFSRVGYHSVEMLATCTISSRDLESD